MEYGVVCAKLIPITETTSNEVFRTSVALPDAPEQVPVFLKAMEPSKLAAEMFAFEIAAAIGTPTPRGILVEIPIVFRANVTRFKYGYATANDGFEDLTKLLQGTSTFLADDLKWVLSREEAYMAGLLDELLGNNDRHPGNVLLRFTTMTLQFIDHERILGPSIKPDERIQNNRLLREVGQLKRRPECDAIARFLERTGIPKSDELNYDQIGASFSPEWVPRSGLVGQMTSLIAARTREIRRMVREQLNAEQPELPYVE